MAYYVTVQDHGRTGFLAGPFNRHGDALATVGAANRAAQDVDPKACWYAFGTAHVKYGPLPKGRLNEMLGFPEEGRITSVPLEHVHTTRLCLGSTAMCAARRTGGRDQTARKARAA